MEERGWHEPQHFLVNPSFFPQLNILLFLRKYILIYIIIKGFLASLNKEFNK